ncbi:MAG TPA: hypothetical protein VII73_13840 [Caulobacteraceae bacterium]
MVTAIRRSTVIGAGLPLPLVSLGLTAHGDAETVQAANGPVAALETRFGGRLAEVGRIIAQTFRR